MKYTITVFLLLLVLASFPASVACKKKRAEYGQAEAEPTAIETPADHEHAFPEMKCTWVTPDTYSKEVVCIGDGVYYRCIKGNCATLARIKY